MSTARRPSGRPRQQAKWWLFSLLVLLYLLHNDLWLWRDSSLLLGLPIGLTYHVLFCLATAVLMALLVRWAWPSELNGDAEDEEPSAP